MALLPSLGSAQSISGKFYEYYVVAKTGATFTALGIGPSINDAREVAFQGTTSGGTGAWYATSTTPVNINPGFMNPTGDIYNTQVQINANHKVVIQDKVTTSSPVASNIILWDATTTNARTFIARSKPSGGFDGVLANPSVNLGGDVVLVALDPTPTKKLTLVPAIGPQVQQIIISGNPKPMIADDGTVVIQVGGSGAQSNQQVRAYPPGLSSPIVIADTATNWTSLDNDPGISRDGRIIVFQGDLNGTGAAAIGTTTGPGIFAAINEGAGFASAKIIRITGTKIEDVAADRAALKGNYDGICDQVAGEICKPAAELGFDAQGNPITIASYGSDSRVGVVNVDLGAAGIDGDSFVVSFIATPSSASRANPAVPGKPLLFSNQVGLWTIRVDVQKQLGGTFNRVYHPFTPIPVAQVGDTIGTDTITGISVYDPIANAAHDESGNIRTMRRGDHRVVFYASTAAGAMIVRGNHLDSDQDGMLDHWETTGIDMDQDGVVDLRLSDYGADPFTRDLFLQVDWVGKAGVDSLKPAGAIFSSDVAGQYSLFEFNLRNAEKWTGAQYGARVDGSPPADIKLGVVPHVDAGFALDSLLLPLSINMGTGIRHGGNAFGMQGDANTLPAVIYYGQPGFAVPGVNVRSYQEVKDTYFGANDKGARFLAFHYMVFGAFQDFKPNYPAVPYSATISQGDTLHIELTQPLSAYPAATKGSFVLMTSGAATAVTRQIDSRATNGVTGNGILNLNAPMSPAPSPGDTMVFLDGSSGVAEVAFAPDPDSNSLPGNDVIVSTGALGVLQGYPPNVCLEAETASHELGHTLGLRHGGTDHIDNKAGVTYKSVMSYTWQLKCTPTPQVPNYSDASDQTFDDYAHLQFNFSDVLFHLSTSLGEARGEGFPSDLQVQNPEQTLLDAIAKNGPLDTVLPTVGITSPAPNGSVAPGGSLVVNVAASDDKAISSVSVSFDANGNGVTDVGEAVNATSTGTGTYQATFANVSGANGSRSVRAIAWDSSSNSAIASISINVGAVTNKCDITGDGNSTVADVQAMVNEAKSITVAHDLNNDGAENVVDIQILIDAALSLGCKAQ